jgi:hypothetical protein
VNAIGFSIQCTGEARWFLYEKDYRKTEERLRISGGLKEKHAGEKIPH